MTKSVALDRLWGLVSFNNGGPELINGTDYVNVILKQVIKLYNYG